MPSARGTHCSVCTLPPALLERAISWRRDAISNKRIIEELHKTHPHITRAMLDACFNAQAHHGPMPATDRDKQIGQPNTAMARLLTEAGIDDTVFARAKRITVRGPREWQSMLKTPEGEAQVVDLKSKPTITLQLAPEWDGPAWPVIQPAKPVKVVAGKGRVTRTGNTCVVLPDVQWGYRRLDTGLEPFHDDRALAVALEVVRRTSPAKIVLLGDNLDNAEFSRFEQEPAFAQTTQASIDACHQYLAALRAAAPDAEIVWLEGNHEARLQKSVIANAKAAFGLRQASTTPESWPVLSIPHLLRLDDLGVKYLAGYPANIYWINDNLCCIHGEKVRSNGSTAAAVIDDERVSVIFGHVHRIELIHKTRRVRAGARTNFAASLGCLCRLDGSVPSTKSGLDVFGKPLERFENWQQACGVVTYEEGDGRFGLEIVPIHEGTAWFRGEQIHACT